MVYPRLVIQKIQKNLGKSNKSKWNIHVLAASGGGAEDGSLLRRGGLGAKHNQSQIASHRVMADSKPILTNA